MQTNANNLCIHAATIYRANEKKQKSKKWSEHRYERRWKTDKKTIKVWTHAKTITCVTLMWIVSQFIQKSLSLYQMISTFVVHRHLHMVFKHRFTITTKVKGMTTKLMFQKAFYRIEGTTKRRKKEWSETNKENNKELIQNKTQK